MVEQIKDNYVLNLPSHLQGQFLLIVENALQKLGYQLPMIKELKETLGYLNKIKKNQFYSILEEKPVTVGWGINRRFVQTRDVSIYLNEDKRTPEGYEILVKPFRGQTQKAKEIAEQIQKDIAEKILPAPFS
jgi:tRNA(Ser,Leu) C12 N-acetylase TAN1